MSDLQYFLYIFTIITIGGFLLALMEWLDDKPPNWVWKARRWLSRRGGRK